MAGGVKHLGFKLMFILLVNSVFIDSSTGSSEVGQPKS